MSEEKENPQEEMEEHKGTGEKFWDATRKTLHSATFQANRYKRIVQKKIDLASLHKKISSAHADLGKLVDDLRGASTEDILATEQVQEIFQRLDGLKQAAAVLEEEIEVIKAETPSEEEEGKKEGPAED